MVAIRKQRNTDSMFFGTAAQEAGVVSGEFFCWYHGQAWSTPESTREIFVGFNFSMRNFLQRLSSNSNTIDGATIRHRVGGAPANLIVTVDQATGSFIDNTNTDVVVSGDNLSFQYLQGDANVGWRCATCEGFRN